MAIRLILASASPRRKEILRSFGIPFEVVEPQIVEKEDRTGDPVKIALHNAQLKADAVNNKYPEQGILAADTVVSIADEILHKPKDYADARSMLKRLSNKTHIVYTGICLKYLPSDINIIHCEMSEVRFNKLDDKIIDFYFAKVNPLDKAGAYGIQEYPEMIIAGYKGHMSNIMGLPIEFLYPLIKKLNLLDQK